MSNSVRVITTAKMRHFEDALEDLSHNEFIEGTSVDRGHFFAVVRTIDTTAIDKLKDDLKEYRQLADELWEVVSSDRDRTVKITQIAMALEEAHDRGMVGEHVGTIELEPTGNET